MKPVAVAVLALALIAGAAAGGYWFARTGATNHAEPPVVAKDEAERKVLYWYDPMHPQQRFERPGKSPFMDMQLVPKYADEATDEGQVAISPRVMQSLGVRTAEARTGSMTERVEVVGSVAYSERSVVVVQARTGGFVERLHARAPLDAVTQGAPLVEILVPEWSAAQTEFLFLLTNPTGASAELVAASRQRLRLLGMGEAEIASVERERKVLPHMTVYAPIAGVIAELGVREGMTVAAGMTLFRLVDLSSVWINAEIPEIQSAVVRPGVRVEARVAAYPGTVFPGVVGSILPEVNAETRTLRARIELANPGARLKPGMYATLTIASAPNRASVLVPSEAVISTGERTVVIVAEAEGRFRTTPVEVGKESRGETEIRKGLKAGEQVVVSGQFLIDSEASLRAQSHRLGEATIYRSKGVLERVGKGDLTISHEPIPALKWGAMTMDFNAPPSGIPAGLRAGSPIEFAFTIPREGEYQVTSIVPAKPGKPAVEPAK
jgi:membrane fusion protein, copper/silver efflux system